MQRILTVCLSYSWGGVERVAVQDALQLARAGMEIHFLCLEGSPTHLSLKQNQSPYLNCVTRKKPPLRYFDPFWIPFLRRWFLTGDLVHLHQSTLLNLFVVALWGFSHPLIVSRHNRNQHSKKNSFHQWIYRRVSQILVMSESLFSNVLETHPVCPQQVQILRAGVDLSFFDPAQAKQKNRRERQRRVWGIDNHIYTLGCVGRLDPAKGQSILIEALSLLKKEEPHFSFRCVFVGEETRGAPPGYLAQLQRQVQEANLTQEILFTGFQEDIPSCMASLDLFIMPSREEAFGLVAIEAMLMGCPVLLSQGGSVEEITQGGKTGWTLKAFDPLDLKRQIQKRIQEADVTRQIAHQAQIWARENYDLRSRSQKTQELYSHLLQVVDRNSKRSRPSSS